MQAGEFLNHLNRLPSRLRTAFAVACAERVLCIYYLDCVPGDLRIAHAVDVAWDYATGGEPTAEEINKAGAGLKRAIPDPNLPGASTPAYFACQALGFALDAIDDPTGESAQKGAFEALDALAAFEDFYGPESRQWSDFEAEWQLRALAVCEAQTVEHALPHMFDHLGPRSPQWLRLRG